MTLMRVIRSFAGAGLLFSVLSGCSGLESHDAIPAAMPTTGSWMSASARTAKSLLYVSVGRAVDVYTYQDGVLRGQLTGFSGPQGQCVDANGDVYIADALTGSLIEYARASAQPMRTLTTNGTPSSCSVAPDGDIAVSNYTVPGRLYGPGSVVVFPGGQGPPKTFQGVGACYDPEFVGYDNNSNLFVQGNNRSYYGSGECYLLPGGSALGVASFSGYQLFYVPAGVMWDGKHITLSFEPDSFNSKPGPTIVYRVKVSGSGSVLTPISSTMLNLTCSNGSVSSPYLVGNTNTPVNTREASTVIGSASGSCSGFDAWAYPGGGNPISSLGAIGGGSSVSFAR